MIPVTALNEWLAKNNLPDAYSINNGNCENFAMDVQHYVPDGEIVGTDNMDGWDSSYPGHIWLFDGKLHFDSESLEGVPEWKQLSIFKRYEASLQ